MSTPTPSCLKSVPLPKSKYSPGDRAGITVAKDAATAEDWYKRGDKLHNPLAQYRLGELLLEPIDHPHGIKRAAALLRESAQAGFVPAMHSLGLQIVSRPELGKSPDEAFSLLTRAAHAGTWKSSVVLGILCRDGRPTAKDYRAAYLHFQVAALEGGEAARSAVRNDLATLAAGLIWRTKRELKRKLRNGLSSIRHRSRSLRTAADMGFYFCLWELHQQATIHLRSSEQIRIDAS